MSDKGTESGPVEFRRFMKGTVSGPVEYRIVI